MNDIDKRLEEILWRLQPEADDEMPGVVKEIKQLFKELVEGAKPHETKKPSGDVVNPALYHERQETILEYCDNIIKAIENKGGETK